MPDDVVRFFDTTLRDGEQAPGIALTAPEKVEIAEQLARLGVDVLEAGFPASSPGDFDAVSRIAASVKGPVIAALCRTDPRDVDRGWEAVSRAQRGRLHLFVSTSNIHRESMLRMSEADVVSLTRAMVERARRHTDDVEFSAQDATRTTPEFLLEVFRAAVRAGATTINVPDTRWLRPAARVRRAGPHGPPGHPRRGGDLRALSQRSRAGRGQLDGRDAGRCSAGRGGGERDRRAGPGTARWRRWR